MADQLSGEQKKQFNKMKHDLEGYREIILVINSVLKWDKPFYAGIVFAVVTFAYLLLWYLNLSILTLFSLICLTSILSEFAIPLVSKFIPKSDNWTGAQEKTFEEVCIDILNVRICVGGLIKYLFLSKDEKTLKYYLITCGTFALLAYAGSIMDNLLICYIYTVLVAFYPGLHHQGIISKAFRQLLSCYTQQLKQIGDKSAAKKAN